MLFVTHLRAARSSKGRAIGLAGLAGLVGMAKMPKMAGVAGVARPLRMATCAILSLGLVACGDAQDDQANDARLLLDRLAAVEGIPERDFEARVGRVEVLQALPLRGEELVRVRDACAEMYGALVEADVQSALVRTIGAPDEDTPPEELARLERAFSEAEAASARVLQHRDACIDGSARLRSRYAPRRRGSE